MFTHRFRAKGRLSDIALMSLLLASVFAFSFTIAAICVRLFGTPMSEEVILSHFSPDPSLSPVRHITRSFYDDAIEMLYLFVLGFTFFGKPGILALSALRGAAFGFSFSSMTAYPAVLAGSISIEEFLLYPLISVTVNTCFIVFAAESWLFNGRSRLFSQNRFRIVKTPLFRTYLLDFICFTGIIVFLKAVYTVLILLI